MSKSFSREVLRARTSMHYHSGLVSTAWREPKIGPERSAVLKQRQITLLSAWPGVNGKCRSGADCYLHRLLSIRASKPICKASGTRKWAKQNTHYRIGCTADTTNQLVPGLNGLLALSSFDIPHELGQDATSICRTGIRSSSELRSIYRIRRARAGHGLDSRDRPLL